MSDVPDFSLSADHAWELGEIVEFISDWIAVEAETLGPSLDRFVGGVYDIDELRGDLGRFAFLLGGDPARFFEDRT